MRRALNLIRPLPHYRHDCFAAGLEASGYRLVHELGDPEPGDCLLIWNRYGRNHERAKTFEAAGARVLIAENAYLPTEVLGSGWYSLAESHHAGAGVWPDLGGERWDGLGIELRAWRTGGTEVLILGQRAIGEPGIASPPHWAEQSQQRLGGRVRPHPGKHPGMKLEHDLRNAAVVCTWASSAAIRALVYGVPVFYAMDRWIGAAAGRPIAEFGQEPRRDDDARLAMLRRLAWAQWHLDEIRSGAAFDALLNHRELESVAA